MSRWVEIVLSVVLGLVLGAVGVLHVFMDLGPADTGAGRLVTGAALFLVAGVVVGLLNPRGRAWLLSGVAAWGLLLLGAYGIWISLTHPPSSDLDLALTFLLGPLSLCLAGGWTGARLRRSLARRSSASGDAARA